MKLLLSLALLFCAVVGGFAETVVLKENRLSLTLPEGWRQGPPQESMLLRADAPKERLRLFLKKLPADVRGKVTDPNVRRSALQMWTDQQFTNVVRSELTKVAGKDAYLTEVMRTVPPQDSILLVVFPHENELHSMTFLALGRSFKGNTNVQGIIESVKALPKK